MTKHSYHIIMRACNVKRQRTKVMADVPITLRQNINCQYTSGSVQLASSYLLLIEAIGILPQCATQIRSRHLNSIKGGIRGGLCDDESECQDTLVNLRRAY